MKYRATKAIIMSAGMGTRLLPLTNDVPKPLIQINGIPLIEYNIEALIKNSIKDIYIVVGHLKDNFYYLKEKYKNVNIEIIFNPNYSTQNNISSLYVAKEHLGNCIISDGDLLIRNPDVLNPNFDNSGYCSIYVDLHEEWIQSVDEDGIVKNCIRTKKEKGFQLFSLSFWSEQDAKTLKLHLERLVEKENQTDTWWDSIPLFLHPEDFTLKIRQVYEEDILEIDGFVELSKIDNSYKKYL